MKVTATNTPWGRITALFMLAALAASGVAMWSGMAGTLAKNTLMPHGVCYLWNPSLIGLHLISDTLIGLAYFTIPVSLVYFIRKRRDLPFNWMFLLFGLFIVACGATHWMEVWTLWNPDYWLSGVLKAITAAASVPTAVALVMLIPQALTIPSTQQLALAKTALEAEIAERTRIEAELRKAQATLEARVDERTRELARATDEARQAHQALQEEDQRKDRFLAILSHELRNPLNPIRSAIAILRRGRSAPEQQANARDVIDRQVTHMAHLLDDLLDISRITQNRIGLMRDHIDVATAINTAVEATAPQVEAAGQQLRLTLPEQRVTVYADPTRLSQIVSNLLNNASKYTDTGGAIALDVGEEGGVLVIRVRDSGIGIDADHLSGVFDLFSRIDTPRNQTVGGLGIGLALVKTLVELHGGTVDASSGGAGQGSEFTVRLPLSSSAVAAPAAAVQPVPSIAGPLRILVVDDNVDSAVSLATLLEIGGHEVRYAHDAAGALEQGPGFLPHVGIFDIGLPLMDGYQLAREVRRQAWGSNMHLIALTGWGKQEDKQQAFAAGFDQHVTKPVDPDALEADLAGVAEAGGRLH